MSVILGIDVTTVIFFILCINFAKIYTASEVISMTLLFGRMLSLVNRFH